MGFISPTSAFHFLPITIFSAHSFHFCRLNIILCVWICLAFCLIVIACSFCCCFLCANSHSMRAYRHLFIYLFQSHSTVWVDVQCLPILVVVVLSMDIGRCRRTIFSVEKERENFAFFPRPTNAMLYLSYWIVCRCASIQWLATYVSINRIQMMRLFNYMLIILFPLRLITSTHTHSQQDIRTKKMFANAFSLSLSLSCVSLPFPYSLFIFCEIKITASNTRLIWQRKIIKCIQQFWLSSFPHCIECLFNAVAVVGRHVRRCLGCYC